jgi:uncharacterized protein DUF4336
VTSTKRLLIERLLGLASATSVEDFLPPPRPIAQNLWVVDRRLRLGRPLTLPIRMTVVRLESGGLFIHSPCRPDAALRDALRGLGPVESVVAPNSFHYLALNAFVSAFPAAQVFLAPGLRERRPELPAGTVLEDSAPAAWSGQIDQAVFGPIHNVSEVVFHHRASRTLLLTDLSFNIRDAGSAWERWMWKTNAAWRRFGPSRTARWTLLRDARVVRPFVARLLQWDFDRIIVTHGEVVECGGAALLRRAFARYLA